MRILFYVHYIFFILIWNFKFFILFYILNKTDGASSPKISSQVIMFCFYLYITIKTETILNMF